MSALGPQEGALAAERAWPAPAKLNLFLHITGRRPDGYHTLQTVFQLLDYGDELTFDLRPDGVIRRLQGAAGVAEEQDLTVRAAARLQREAGVWQGVDIRVLKRIPMGAGLGGGSSDAATTLVALNALWGVNWPLERLAGLAVELGADVPVFVHGYTAWAEGVGERLRPLRLPERWYVVITPNCTVSTGRVFSDPALTRNTPPIKMVDFAYAETRNDCEHVVRECYPEVARALDWLGRWRGARLTGTGASVFAAFPERAQARRAAAQVPPAWEVFVARGVNRSPLLDRLREVGASVSDGA